jgi:hypothetical protein
MLGLKTMSKNGHLNDAAAGLRDSLSAIRHAQVQLRHLTGTCTSPTMLASQIELCEVLLGKISGIRSSLAEDLKQTLQARGHTELNS